MTENEAFVVQTANPDRLYAKIYHDFLDSSLLNGKEKLIFILLKRYLNFRDDKSGIVGTVYPTLETLSKQAGMTRKTVGEIIKKLEQKGLIVIKKQGLNRPNIYTIRDFSDVWMARTDEEVKAAIEMYEDEYEDSKIIERLRNKGYTIIKEKAPETTNPTKEQLHQAHKKNHFDMDNITTNLQKCQVSEHFTLNDIRTLYDYDLMINNYPYLKTDIDSIMSILHTNLNTTKDTIRINGEDMPSMVVIKKLMKLTCDGILYSLDKYKEQTARIKNPTSYMLTLLYNAEEQMNLDITNQVQHDMYHWNPTTEE